LRVDVTRYKNQGLGIVLKEDSGRLIVETIDAKGYLQKMAPDLTVGDELQMINGTKYSDLDEAELEIIHSEHVSFVFARPVDSVGNDVMRSHVAEEKSTLNPPNGCPTKAGKYILAPPWKYVHTAKLKGTWRGRKGKFTTSDFHTPKQAALMLECILRWNGVSDNSKLNFPQLSEAEVKEELKSMEDSFTKYVHLDRMTGRWVGIKWVEDICLVTKAYRTSREAAKAMDTIMRQEGLSETLMNFPIETMESAVSDSEDEGSRESENGNSDADDELRAGVSVSTKAGKYEKGSLLFPFRFLHHYTKKAPFGWRGSKTFKCTLNYTKILPSAESAALLLDLKLRSHDADKAELNFPHLSDAELREKIKSKDNQLKYVHFYESACQWKGVKWLDRETCLVTKAYDTAKEAAQAMDEMMRNEGLSERFMNFPLEEKSDDGTDAAVEKETLKPANAKKKASSSSRSSIYPDVKKKGEWYRGWKRLGKFVVYTQKCKSARKAHELLQKELKKAKAAKSKAIGQNWMVSNSEEDPFHLIGKTFVHYFQGYGNWECTVIRYVGGAYEYTCLDGSVYSATGVNILRDMMKRIDNASASVHKLELNSSSSTSRFGFRPDGVDRVMVICNRCNEHVYKASTEQHRCPVWKVKQGTCSEKSYHKSASYKHVYSLDKGETWFAFVSKRHYEGTFRDEKEAAIKADAIVKTYGMDEENLNFPAEISESESKKAIVDSGSESEESMEVDDGKPAYRSHEIYHYVLTNNGGKTWYGQITRYGESHRVPSRESAEQGRCFYSMTFCNTLAKLQLLSVARAVDALNRKLKHNPECLNFKGKDKRSRRQRHKKYNFVYTSNEGKTWYGYIKKTREGKMTLYKSPTVYSSSEEAARDADRINRELNHSIDKLNFPTLTDMEPKKHGRFHFVWTKDGGKTWYAELNVQGKRRRSVSSTSAEAGKFTLSKPLYYNSALTSFVA